MILFFLFFLAYIELFCVFLTKYKSTQHHFLPCTSKFNFYSIKRILLHYVLHACKCSSTILLILCSFLIHNDTVIWEPSCIWSFQPSVQQFNFRKWMVFLWRKFALLVHKRMHKLVWKWSVGKLTTTLFQQVW